MSNPIPTIALSVGCDKNLRRQLCQYFGYSELQLTTVDVLQAVDSRFAFTNFEFIALHRESLAQTDGETAEHLQQLAASTPMLLIVGDDFEEYMTAKSLANQGSDNAGPSKHSALGSAEVAPMIEHASCNVLQRINLLINEIKAATHGDENVGRNIQRIESANQTLRNHIQNLRGVSEPIQLNLENRRIDQLLQSIRPEKNEHGVNFAVEFSLNCEESFSLDAVRMKSVARAILAYLSSINDTDSTICVYDESVMIAGESFLRISFQIDYSSELSNPLIELAMFKRIVELHSGFLDFESANPEKTVCTLCLPVPINSLTDRALAE